MLTIRAITPKLVDSYKAVRLRALRDTPSAFGSTYAKESQMSDAEWRQRAARFDGEQAVGYLAFDGDEACGIAAGFVDSEDPKRAHLVSMWIAPTHRRHGAGAMLVNRVIEWAQSRGVEALCLLVTSNNDAATCFYERLGFTRTGRVEPYPNDPNLNECEMIRKIPPVRVDESSV